jgi:hypothetical protein
MSNITIHVYDGDPDSYVDHDEANSVGARISDEESTFSDGEELDAVAAITALVAEYKHFDVRFFNN